MSLLFDLERRINVRFVVKEDGIDLPDLVFVGKTLWTQLFDSAGIFTKNRCSLSVAPLRRSRKHREHQLQSLVCWSTCDETLQPGVLAIPKSWTRRYGHIFSEAALYKSQPGKSLSIAATEPIYLEEIILTALSDDAYMIFGGSALPLNQWLHDRYVRQGEVLTFSLDQLPVNGHVLDDPERSYKYKVELTEPVLQGLVGTGTTRVVVLVADKSSADIVELRADINSEDSFDAIEIDESFLANASAPCIPHLVQTSLSSESSTTSPQLNGNMPDEPAFRLKALSECQDPLQDDCTLYLRTSDLSRVGVLNGDWAVVNNRYSSNHRRQVRIVSADEVSDEIGVAVCSPILLRNICSESDFSMPAITIQPSPSGSRLPPIPTAKSITIARVASPFSTDKMYQAAFLHSLKAYLEKTKRLFKHGDVIAIGLDTDAVARSQEAGEDGGIDMGLTDHSFPATNIRLNEVVLFIVTNIEYDVIRTDAKASSHDMYVNSTAGELGCWLDHASTRVIQTGLEHERAPKLGTYLNSADARSAPSLLQYLESLPSSPLLAPDSPFGKMHDLAAATSLAHAVDYHLDLTILLKGARGSGKFTVACWVAQCLGLHLLEVDCFDIVGENDTKTEAMLRVRFEKAAACSPCLLVLRHIDALAQTTQVLETGKEPVIAGALKECIDDLRQSWKMSGFPVIVVGTTAESGHVPMAVLSCFKQEISIEAPGEPERRDILKALLMDDKLGPDVSLSTLAIQTAALVAADLVDLVSRANFEATKRTTTSTGSQGKHVRHAGILLTAADFEAALSKARASYSESIGAPKIPNVTWDDIGGLAHVKADILDTIQLPLDHPELFADGLKKRSGILLYGPPGTGKTLVAKAVATSCSLNFFSVKGPELLNMYIGESEANVRRVFQRARNAKPCVIFFDELDSVAPKRGNHGDSGGVMDRIVSQLLAELDGMSAGKGGADVFVIGATNRPDLLDPALLRPGRFDRLLYLGVSDTHETQRKILEALTRKFKLHPDLSLSTIAEQCPFNYTGADFYALCSDAMLNAMSRKAEELEVKIAQLNDLPGPHDHPHPLTPQYYLAEMAAKEDYEVLVSQADFDLALRKLVPSVSQSEMDHYASIQKRFSQDASRADGSEDGALS